MIEVRKLQIRFPAFSLVDLCFDVPRNAYCTLMGPTGSGKTSILEVICGLRKARGGTIRVAGRDITGVKPGERNIGYVPQDGALFPTMSVRQQIEFGMRLRRWSAAEMSQRIDELTELLGIGHLLARKPQGLSGGERQRVALGRAIAFRPRVLCMDEPLSALDEATRERTHELLKCLHQSEQATVLHVTHSSHESRVLATHPLCLENGKIVRPQV